MAHDAGLQELNNFVQQALGLSVAETATDAEPDFRGLGSRGYSVIHGRRSCMGSREPYHATTMRNLTQKERDFLFAMRARDDVAEEHALDVGISRAAGQKLLHACSLVVEDASVDPVWLQLPGRSHQMPAMRWVNSAASIVSEKIQYTQADTPFMAGSTLAEFELLVPRGHVRYKQPGLPATTLHRHCRNEIDPPLPEVLRKTPLYVAAGTVGITCRVGVIAHPEGFRIVLTDCEEVARELLVPFEAAAGSFSGEPWQHGRSIRTNSDSHGSDSLRSALQDAISQWVQDADAWGVPHWELLWVTPAPANYLLACLEPALRWPPQADSVMVAAKGEIVLSQAAFSAALRQALKDAKRDDSLRPSRAATVFTEIPQEDDSPGPSRSKTTSEAPPQLLTVGSELDLARSPSTDELQEEPSTERAPKVRQASSLANWAPTLEEVVPVIDTHDPSRQQRYIAKLQDSLAEELAIAMGVDPEDVIVSSIEEDENGNWKAIFSANATKTEMDAAMAGRTEKIFPPDGPDVRMKKLQSTIKHGGFAKDSRFTMLRHADADLHVHEIERLQITDTAAWCRGLGGFTVEDTRKLTGIFLTPEAIYRKAYNGTGLTEDDLKRLRGTGFTDADLRRLGLLGYGLSEDEAARLEMAGFGLDELQRRLLTGDMFSKDEQSTLKAEGFPLERLRRLLAGTGRFSKAEKDRLNDVDLPEMEIRRRLILGEEFENEELARLEEIDLPLHELRRRVLGGEIFDRDERLRLDVVGLHEDEILKRLTDREEFCEEERFRLESAGFDVEDLHRRVFGESTFAPTELQRLQAFGFTEEEIIRRLCDGMGFDDDELRRLELAGFSLAKLTRRVFGTSNPTKEEEQQSRAIRSASGVFEEGSRRLGESQIKKALRRLSSDAHLLSEDDHTRLADVGLPVQEIRRRLSTGEGFSEMEILTLNSAALSQSLNRLAPSISEMDEQDRERLETCGIPVEEIKRRTLCGEDFTLEEIDRIHANGFSIDALQRSVMAEEHDDSDDEDLGQVLFTKAKAVAKTVQISMPFADELARLLQERYVSHEKSQTNAMQTQVLDELRTAASSAADDPSEITLAELAKAIARAIRAEVEEEHITEATELLQMLRAQFLQQLLEASMHLEDIAELGAMLTAVEGKVRELDLFRTRGADEEEEAEGLLLGFYPRDLDPRRALRGLITRARTKQEKANAEARLEEIMGQIHELPLDSITQVQRSLSSLQDAMRFGEEAGASAILMFAAEELMRDLQLRRARYDDFNTERTAAWTHLQQSLQGLQATLAATLSQKKALQHTLLTQDWRSTRIPSQFREQQLAVAACPVSKSLQTSLTNFLEINFASTDDLRVSTENLIELLPAIAGLVVFFQLEPPTDVFQLHDRREDILCFWPQLMALVDQASPPIGPVPALLKDLVRDMDKLVAMWTAIEIEAMPKGLYQAIMSGITDLVAACLAVCGDKESVIARVRDDRGGNAIHLAAIHGHWQVIQVLADNGADLHAVNDHQQSALDLAIEMYKKLSDHDHQVELSRRLQETIDYLANQHNVISYEYVQYEKKKTWFKRPDTMLKWLRLKNLLEYHFDNLKQAFLEIDTNHSGGIVKYEWEAMFGAEGQVKEALAAAGLESNDVFAMLDGLDVEGKMVITKSAFDLLEMLDWHLTSRIWQDLILKPLMAKPHSSTRQRNMAQTTAF